MRTFDIFGIHEQALMVASRRMTLLAGNLANAETPGYKARDIDFRAVLGKATGEAALRTTNPRHLDGGDSIGGSRVLYRSVMQPSLDGNTVDPSIERSQFMENALRYQATLRFLNGKISGLREAIGGR